MLFSFMGIGAASLSQDEIETLKSALSSLTDERKLLLQQHKILKSSKAPIAYLSSTSDRLAFGEKVTNLEKLQSKIAELRKRRNLISTRKSKWDNDKRAPFPKPHDNMWRTALYGLQFH
jgi:phage shock protein A